MEEVFFFFLLKYSLLNVYFYKNKYIFFKLIKFVKMKVFFRNFNQHFYFKAKFYLGKKDIFFFSFSIITLDVRRNRFFIAKIKY